MKIGIVTAFSQMVDSYSLTAVVIGQLRMIHHAGHQPVLIGLEDFKWDDAPSWVEIRAGLPVWEKKDYHSLLDLSPDHIETAKKAARWMVTNLNDLDGLFTHDIIFTGWNLPLNVAMQEAASCLPMPHLHWVHSIPGLPAKDFWKIPAGGYIVYPNHQDQIRCAEHFHVWQNRVLVVPHSKDPREFLVSTQLASDLISEYDTLGADVVQTYPVPTDRGDSKGICEVIELFGHLKRTCKKTVQLIFCNANCTNDELRAEVKRWLNLAFDNGLTDREVIFTSRFSPEHEGGVSQAVVRDLMQISNLFICPTKGETFGYAVAEAALCGQLLVLNQNLPMFQEVAGPGSALHLTFGSFQQNVSYGDRLAVFRDFAKIVASVMDSNHVIRAKTFYRQQYRWENIWRRIEQALLLAKLQK